MNKQPIHIASCSFGKDSLATILLALENNEPLDRVVYAEVMFDNARGISGEIPEHIEWVYNTAIPTLESMGVKVDVVRSDQDYISYFSRTRKSGKYNGKIYGYPIGGMCVINRDCKIAPIKSYYKQFEDYPIVQYVGIAKDEPKRLARLNGNKISLLDKYGYTEAMAKALCEKYGLLSPIYQKSTRGGCWFCPNCRYKEFAGFKMQHPNLWGELEKLSHTPNLCSYSFKYKKTFQEVDAIVDGINNQLFPNDKEQN